MECLHWSI
ncbi:unnamed protein product [Amaranthus hypochondriacus]